MNPQLSIIVPVYNAKNYLSQCIESILKQKYTNFELIIINDGSTDDSEEICKPYIEKDKRIIYKKINNQGASTARNVGINLAKGEYIWFIDADDWIDSNFMSKEVLLDNPDIIFFGYKKYINGHLKDFPIQCNDFSNRNKNFILTKLYESKELFFGFTWNKLFKKEIIIKNNIRFNENLIYKEDEVFTLEYCKKINNIKLLDNIPYNYRILKNSLSHNKKGNRKIINYINYMDLNLDISTLGVDFYNIYIRKKFFYLLNAAKESKDKKSQENIIKEIILYYKNHKSKLILPRKFIFLFKIPSNFLIINFFKIIIKKRN